MPPLAETVHPLADLPRDVLAQVISALTVHAVEAGTSLRAGWGGADALAFVLEGAVEWVWPSPGRAAAPARTAAPGRAFLVRQMDEEGPHPRVVRWPLLSRRSPRSWRASNGAIR